jgi:flagellar biosynthetic protein FlhB
MADSDGDKQHDATPHRRQQAREEGQVARSQDLASAALLLVGLLGMLYGGEDLVLYFGNLFRDALGGSAWRGIDHDSFTAWWFHLAGALAMAIVPLLGLLLLAAIGVNLGQVGIMFLPQKLAPDWSHVDPLQNAQRMFSMASLIRLGFGLIKVGIVGGMAIYSLWSEQGQLMNLGNLEAPQVAAYLTSVTLWTCIKIASALLVLALLDYGYQFWKREQDMKMTTQELREELKEQQGDPQIISRRRQAHRQMVQSKMASAVPKADVVVTNPTELAIAIQFDIDTMSAPVVVAKGAGAVAQRIRRLALEHTVPIVERKELAQVLYKTVDLGKQVPMEQYAAVAEVLRYVYQLKGKKLPTPNAA